MRRGGVIGACTVLALGCAGAGIVASAHRPPAPTVPHRVVTSTSTTIKKPFGFELPARLVIDKLHIDQAIQAVDVAANGSMDVPRDLQEVGWLKRNPAPGNKGNAVIAGHKGIPGNHGIFWSLDQLVPGDNIRTYDTTGREARFVVSSVEHIQTGQAPLPRIFGVTDKRQLNLITCDGEWLPATQDYTHRLVVFTELQE